MKLSGPTMLLSGGGLLNPFSNPGCLKVSCPARRRTLSSWRRPAKSCCGPSIQTSSVTCPQHMLTAPRRSWYPSYKPLSLSFALRKQSSTIKAGHMQATRVTSIASTQLAPRWPFRNGLAYAQHQPGVESSPYCPKKTHSSLFGTSFNPRSSSQLYGTHAAPGTGCFSAGPNTRIFSRPQAGSLANQSQQVHSAPLSRRSTSWCNFGGLTHCLHAHLTLRDGCARPHRSKLSLS
jgi:hypothetical protein